MLKSMTGFGVGESQDEGARVSVEVRCCNYRFCEVGVHLPRALGSLEPRIIELVRGRIARGRVQVLVAWEEGAGAPVVNMALARAYREGLEALKRELKLGGKVDIGLLAGLPEVVRYEREEADVKRAWRLISSACSQALEEVEGMRKREGERLKEFFLERLEALEGLVGEVEGLASVQVERIRERLEGRIKEMGVQGWDPERVAMEVALLAQRSDVTEECVRLRSHISQFRGSVERGGVVGRRLEFLLQEMYREVNTIGAKAADARVSHLAVALKEGIEQLREQVQNVE